MRIETWGGLRVRVTGGSDREGGGGGPVIVLLHGFGARGDDLVQLWRVMSVGRDVRFVFPEAPLSSPELAPHGGRAWWHIDIARMQQAAGGRRDRSQEVPDGLEEANAMLNRMLDTAADELDVPEGQLVLGGFSQGAMLACDVALNSDRPLAGLVLLSATLIAKDRWTARMPARAGLRIMQSHGMQDPLLPFAAAEALRDLLIHAGCRVEWTGFRGGHEIPMPVLQKLGTFVESCT